ncbi:MAG: cell division site-positioning protein MapZ family protein [Lactovum sp.]
MSEELENKDLQSSSSLDSSESFEEKMSRIKSILAGQQVEIEARRGEGEEESEEFSSFDSFMADEEFLPEANPESFEGPSQSYEDLFSEEEMEQAAELNFEGNLSEEALDSAQEINFNEENLEELSTTDNNSEGISAQLLSEPRIHNSDEINKIIAKDSESLKKKEQKKKSKLVPIIVTLAILLLLVFAAIALSQKFKAKAPVESSSSLSSSSEKSSSSESSSESSSSSSVTSEAPKTREEIIASVGDSPVAPLDASLTGKEAAFTWPAGLKDSFINQMVEAGRITKDSYELVPAQIAGGQGWVNLYDANKKFVASINLTTGYVLQ